MPGERLLLSTVGTSDYEQTRFALADGRETRAAISPVALVRLLDIDAVLLTHTATVRIGESLHGIVDHTDQLFVDSF